MRKPKIPKNVPAKYAKAYQILLKKDIAADKDAMDKAISKKSLKLAFNKDLKKTEVKKHIIKLTKAQVNKAKVAKKAKKAKKTASKVALKKAAATGKKFGLKIKASMNKKKVTVKGKKVAV